MYVKYDLALFSQDTRFIDRCKRICEKFGYVFKHFDNTSQFVTEHTEYRLIAIAGMEFPNGGELSAFLSTVKTGAPDAFLLFVEHAKGVENAITIAKSFGCDLTLKEGEFFDTSKPEFICSQVIRATYLPIKSTDISSGKVLTFDLYHFMPQREKFLKFCFEGDQIDPKKLEKLKSVDEVYIHRDQAAKFATYMTVGANTTNAEEMNRRCRGQFIAFYASYTNFVFQITDQSGEKTFQAGLDLLKKCKALAMDLLVTLATHPDPWNIISKATVGDFGSLERAPAVAAYAGIIGTLMGIDQTEDLMVSALLSELGILLLPEPIMDHIRKGTVDQLTEEQLKIYNNYPRKSISIVLDKKVQID